MNMHRQQGELKDECNRCESKMVFYLKQYKGKANIFEARASFIAAKHLS